MSSIREKASADHDATAAAPGCARPGSGRPMAAPGSGFASASPGARADAYLDHLKAALDITREQQSAWSTYAQAIQSLATAMLTLREATWQPGGTAPERMARHVRFMRQRLDCMDAAAQALKALYSMLTPEQRAALDESSRESPGMPLGPFAG